MNDFNENLEIEKANKDLLNLFILGLMIPFTLFVSITILGMIGYLIETFPF